MSTSTPSRYCRLKYFNTIFVCGTDEYGTATETKAQEEGVSCQQLCDKYHALHASVYKWFNIGFDHFGRTTNSKHKKIAQDIFLKLHDKKLLHEECVQQHFCMQCERFLSDRFVEGICPLCGFLDARGDQCDGCGKLLNAIDLIQPKCKNDGSTPVIKESTQIFLELNNLQDRCEKFIEKSSSHGFWSSNARVIAQSWLKEGLRARCITRDLQWGTPVPLEEFKKKVLYVWFDAPIGFVGVFLCRLIASYMSITAEYTDSWELWWKDPKNVELYQFMGFLLFLLLN